MLFSPLSGVQPQRLLPATLEVRLIGFFGRVGGYGLLAIVAGVWLSLMTWALTDPSLTHATGGPARNAIGPIGAIISDLLLQTLGFATAFALLAPMFWGLELILGERILRFRAKASFFPLAVLVLAGALSSLPVPAGWPLHHGLGGILGDVVYNLAFNVFAIINPDRAGAAAGLLFFITGFPALMHSIGLELRDLTVVAMRSPYSSSGTWSDNLSAEARRLRRGLTGMDIGPSLAAAPKPSPVRQVMQPRYEAEPEEQPEADETPASVSTPDSLLSRGMGVLSAWTRSTTSGNETDEALFDAETPAGRGANFDSRTDEASRAIAQRFAPVSKEAHSAASLIKSAFLGSGLGSGPVRKPEPQYRKPSAQLLKRPSAAKTGPEFTQTMLRGNARLLEDVLNDFGVKGEVKDIRPGPVVTLYEFEPARGTKSSRVIGLADDIARSMSAQSVRVAVVPGRNVIGIELPNVKREPVLLREILDTEAFRSTDAVLPMALGKSIGGEPIVVDLARMPHLLVAGTTGSGKSVGINAFILSLLFRHSPEDCRLLMIDPKMLELSVYNGIPHLLTPVVTDPQHAVSALNWVVREMEERYKRMSKLSVRSIDVFNNRVRNSKKRGELIARTVQTGFDARTGRAIYESQNMDLEPMPHIVVVVDEFADLMIVAGKEIEAAVQRLAQMARAAGIHLIMATQRPSVDVVTGTIKANFPTRISFKVASKVDSRTILNDQGAEQLLGQGDMLYSGGSGQVVRVHGPYVSDEEVESITASLRQQGEPNYVDGITDAPQTASGPAAGERVSSDGDIYDRAVAIVLRDRKASTSYIQRRLGVGYNRAADLIERMQSEGLISAANAVGKREILAGPSAGAEID